MKKIKNYLCTLKLKAFLSIAFLVAVCVFSSCNSEKNIGDKEIDYKTLAVSRHNIVNAGDLGSVTRAVKLETSDESVIASVDLVRCDTEGNIYVGDFQNQGGSVLLFDREGKFLRRFGKQGEGPGEHLSLSSFDILPDKSLVLLTSTKLIKIDKDGNLVKEIRLNYTGRDIAVLKGLIYVHVGLYRHTGAERKAIHIYTGSLEKSGELYSYDNRIEKYNFDILKRLAADGRKLYYISQYDFKLKIFDPQSGALNQLIIPNENDRLDVTWGKKNFIEEDRDEIKDKLHRFQSIYALDGKLFLVEYCKEKRIFDFWLLDLSKKKIVIFPYSGIGPQVKGLLFWNRGSDKGNMIVSMNCNNKEDFAKYQTAFPPLQKMEFNLDDNPVLLFFKFKDF